MAQLPEDVDFDPESEEEPGFGVSCLSEPGAEEQCPCPLIGTDAVGSDAKSPAVEENGSEKGDLASAGHFLTTPKSATGLATLPAVFEPGSLRAYLAKMCPRNEDNKKYSDQEIMKSEASGPVQYWFSMSDCQVIMDRAGLSEVVHIVTDEALQRDPAAPQECFVAYWVRLEALLALYVSRKYHGVSFFNKSDEKVRSVLAALGYEDDDQSREAKALRKSLGPKRVQIPVTADKGDCLVDSCCKVLRVARGYGLEVKVLEVPEEETLPAVDAPRIAGTEVHCSICLRTWVPPQPRNALCPDCGIEVSHGWPLIGVEKPKRRGASSQPVGKKVQRTTMDMSQTVVAVKPPPAGDDVDEFSLASQICMPASQTAAEVEYMTAAEFHSAAQCSGDHFGFVGYLHFQPGMARKVQPRRGKEEVNLLKIVLADQSAPIQHLIWRDVVDKFLEFARQFPAEGRVMIGIENVTAKKEVGNAQNMVASPMRMLHSTAQTEYQVLDQPTASLTEKRPCPVNLLVLKFAALSKCTKPTTLNLVGYIDQVKGRETETGNYLTRGRIRDKSGTFLEFAALGRHAYSIANRGDCEMSVWFAVLKPPSSEVRCLWVYDEAQIYFGQHLTGGSYSSAKTAVA